MNQTIVASDGQLWTLPDFIKSPEEAAERDTLLSLRFFLVRQGSLGEIFRCKECNGKHQFFSLRCCERPFSGIAEGLWAYTQAAGTPEALRRMTPAEKRQVANAKRLLGTAATLPDLASSHPQFARGIGVAERDLQLAAMPLGILEEVPASLAQRFQDRINLRGLKPPLALPGLRP